MGKRWEAEKYQDLIDLTNPHSIHYEVDEEFDPLVGRKTFSKIENLVELLSSQNPPAIIIEAEFQVPKNLTPTLQQTCDQHKIETMLSRPDILWIRPYGTGVQLLGEPKDYEFEIHIIDVKMAAEPALRHFTEVTYYALALQAALKQWGLDHRYSVSAAGFIWPGNHDANAFRKTFNDLQARQASDPLTEALLKTLKPVPYEVYQVHVRQFLEERLPKVMAQEPLRAAWHVAPKCQLCDNLAYCKVKAKESNHLSRLPWFSQGQAEALRRQGIKTTIQLAKSIRSSTQQWQRAVQYNQPLRADAPALLARAGALHQDNLQIIEGRKSQIMPRYSEMKVHITVHFDPGSGITFGMGASLIYFSKGFGEKVRPDERQEKLFIVDRADSMSPEHERLRLVEFARKVLEWLRTAARHNEELPEDTRDGHRAHIFVWDSLELKQLKRMMTRHLQNSEVSDVVNELSRFFPSDMQLPDPRTHATRPVTTVKEVVRQLVGLPVAHDYTLFETANHFYPDVVAKTQEPYQYRLPFGFVTDMSDQIPFERAYELWSGRIMLKQFREDIPREEWSLYTKDEVYQGIRYALSHRLKALENVVEKLQNQHGDLLILRNKPFKMAPLKQARLPQEARELIAFGKLDAISSELENQEKRALPVDEREARFFSIRGIQLAVGEEYDELQARIKREDERYRQRELLAFTFSPDSRDARIKEGEFLLALSNEIPHLNLDMMWSECYDPPLEPYQGQDRISHLGLGDGAPYYKLSRLLQVTVVKLLPAEELPVIVLALDNSELFKFAQAQGFIDLERPMVLDPLEKDFNSDLIEKVLRDIGGPTKSKKSRA